MRGKSYVLREADDGQGQVGWTVDRCGNSVAKIVLIAANVLVFAMSIAVLAVSAWALSDEDSLWTLLGIASNSSSSSSATSARVAAILLIVTAVLAALAVLLGCFAAAAEDKRLLLAFAAALLALLLCALAGAVLAANGDLEGGLTEPLVESMAEYDEESADQQEQEVTDAWDDIQQEYLCCGAESYQDWSSHCPSLQSPNPFRVPAACCQNLPAEAGVDVDVCRRNPGQYLGSGKVGADVGRGCAAPLAQQVEDGGDAVLWTAVVAIIVMIFDLIAAGLLYFQMASV